MASKTIKVLVVAAAMAIAAYWYWSPFLAVRQMRAAAHSRDADAFDAHVDYLKLRESIKNQYSGGLADKFGNAAASGDDFAKLGAVFGDIIGKAVVSPMVDALVRPENLMRAMQVGRLSEPVTDEHSSDTAAQSAVNPGKPKSVESEDKDDKVKWTYERQGVDKVTAYATDRTRPDEQNQKKLGLVLQRSGFATWKLTEVRLPRN